MAPEPERKSNKRIIWDHFTDTIWLIALELMLLLGINWIGHYVPDSTEMLASVRTFSKWFVIAALAQFAIESSLDLAARDVDLLYQILRRRGGPPGAQS